MGFLDTIAEDGRALEAARFTGTLGTDERYWQDYSYAFKLHGPGFEKTFTLVLAPERMEKTHPFARELTVAQEGGVVVERQGVIISQLVIAGHTGVSPRESPSKDDGISVPLSGQAHFLRLERDCFLEYSKLVKDPRIAADVFMTFHNLRDNEHWIVEPGQIKLSRTKERRLHYPYEITLDILGPAESNVPKGLEDFPILKEFMNAYAQIAKAVFRIDAALDDLAGVAEDVRGALGQANALVDEAANGLSRVSGAARDFVRGVKVIIGIPYRALQDVQEDLDSLLDTLSQVADLPEDITQMYRQTVDALEALGAYPERFSDAFADVAASLEALVSGPAEEAQADLDAAAAAPQTQVQALRGTGLRRGDAARVRGGLFDRLSTFPRYQGLIEYTVAFNDTLPGIAAAQLGDARRWIDIAIVNGLRAPYISTSGLEGTAVPGEAIDIPTLSATPATQDVRSSGVEGESSYDALLGRDLLLEDVGNDLVDWVVDLAGGGLDFSDVSGVDNLTQALKQILATERGTNILYAKLGFKGLVGRPGTFDRLVEGQLSISEALLRDPRIDRVRAMRFVAELDTLLADIDLELIQNIQFRTIAPVLT